MWIKSTLGEYINFKNGKSSPERCDSHSIPVYGSNGLIGYADKSNAPCNSLIIGRVGSYCGSVYYSESDCWVTDNAIIGTPKHQEDSRFWYFVLRELNLNSYRSGSGQPLINQSTLNTIPANVPNNLQTRVDIGNLLYRYNKKIELNTQINQTLEEMAQGIFKSWFVDFDPVRAKVETLERGGTAEEAEQAAMCAISGRDPAALRALQSSSPDQYQELAATAALFPSAFEDSPLGPIPQGWKPNTIEAVSSEIYSGGTPSTNNPLFWNGDIPWFSSGETRNRFVIRTEKMITNAGVYESSTKPVYKGTVLIASAGQGHTRGQTSLCAIDCYINQSVVAIKPLSDGYSAWNYYNLQRRYEELRAISDSHSIRGSLTTKLIRDLHIVHPGTDLIFVFSATAAKLIDMQIANGKQNIILEHLRNALLPKLLSGEIDVSQIEAVTAE